MPASSYVNREHVGGAVDTTTSSDITAISLTIPITSAVGWPTGGANGPFHVIIDYDVAGKEKVEIQSRTGTSLTVADTGKRGIDGTSAQSHTSGATIRHCVTAIDIQEANDHITNTTLDHHTQYLNAARHAAVTHTSAMLGTDSVGSDEIATGAVGSAELASSAVIAGKIAAGGISASNQFAAGVVDSAAIGALAVTAGKLGPNSVGNAEILDGQVGSGELGTGAVTAGKIAAGGVSAGSQIADAIVTLAKMAAENPTAKGGSNWNNVTIGTGGVDYNSYLKIGKLVVGLCGFTLGTGGNVTGTLQVQLPFVAGQSPIDGIFAGRGFDASGSSGGSGLGIILDGEQVGKNLVTLGTNSWDATVPWNWDVGDTFRGLYIYFTA